MNTKPVSIQQQAAENEGNARAIIGLYKKLKTEVTDVTHSQHSIRAIDFIFQTPFFFAPIFSRILGHFKESYGSKDFEHLTRS